MNAEHGEENVQVKAHAYVHSKNKNGNMPDTSNYRPVAVATVGQSYLSTSYYLTSLLSLVPQTISLVLSLVTVLINVHFC